MPAKNAGDNKDADRELDTVSRCDFSWILFVGVKMLGFTEREVGHFTLKKWLLLFEQYKKYHNFKVQGHKFKEPEDEINPNGWIPF